MVELAVAVPGDAGALAGLFAEMDGFYGHETVGTDGERAAQVTEALFGEPAGARALLARRDGELAGVACYVFLWPAVGLSRSLYLKELYVRESARGHGVGRRLMAGLFEIAERHGCSRVEWTGDEGNPAAQRFYAGLGVPVNRTKLFYRARLGS